MTVDGPANFYPLQCPGNLNKTGVFMALFLLALGATVLVIADLVRVLDENDNDRAFAWEKRLASCREKVVAALPLTSIKIVVVAWQIITQVNEGVYGCFSFVVKDTSDCRLWTCFLGIVCSVRVNPNPNPNLT